MYIINHVDSDEIMEVEAENASKAKYKNYLGWREAFSPYRYLFTDYLKGLRSCKKAKGE